VTALATMSESQLRTLLGTILIEKDGKIDVLELSHAARSAIQNEIARRTAHREPRS
jgi:hypothetical protein